MVIKNKKKLILVSSTFLLILFFFIGCKESEVSITKEYVINPNWNEVNNTFQVIKMNFKNKNKIDLTNVSSSDLLEGLEEDTCFAYIANVKYNGVDYSKRKVYFDKYNGFFWGKLNDRHNKIEKEFIGPLEHNIWYILKGLSNVKTLYYVYIDSNDSLYIFKMGAKDWTNY